MQPDIETLGWILAVSVVVALAAYWVLRLVAARIAHRVALLAERQIGAALTAGVSRVPGRFTRPPVATADLRARRRRKRDR